MNEPVPPPLPAGPGQEEVRCQEETEVGWHGPWVLVSKAVQLAQVPSAGRRFVSLSSLPEGQRLPPKRDLSPVRQSRMAPPVPDGGKFPLLSSPDAIPPTASPVPSVLPAPVQRQLGFNCPACFAVLVIKDPVSYDGCPAPCPTCGSRILPPRCVPESPFSIVPRPANSSGKMLPRFVSGKRSEGLSHRP